MERDLSPAGFHWPGGTGIGQASRKANAADGGLPPGQRARAKAPAQELRRCSGVKLSMTAIRLSSGREWAFIFRIRLVRCTFTVDSAMPVSVAIHLFRHAPGTRALH